MKILCFVLTMLLVSPAFSLTCEETYANIVKGYVDQCVPWDCVPNGGSTVSLSIHDELSGSGNPTTVVRCRHYSCHNGGFITEYGGSVGKCSTAPRFSAERASNQIIKPTNHCGSIVQIENQSVGESIPLTGVSFNLNYFTHWSQGKSSDYRITVPIAGNSVRDGISSFDVEVKDGSTVVYSTSVLNNTPNVDVAYYWDGLDSTSAPMIGTKTFQVKVTEHHSVISIPIISQVTVGSFKSVLLGLGGWLPSIYNYYDSNSKKLYRGNGEIRSVEAKPWNTTGFLIAAEDGTEVYFFDSTGRQLYTKTGLLGTTTHTFNYDSQGRLSSIAEAFNRTTTFNRGSSGNFTGITAPKGQATLVTLDNNGYVSTVTNPNSETYAIAYIGTQGLIQSFTKPGLQTSTFIYDNDGNLTQDAHSGGYFFELVKNLNSYYRLDFSKTTPMGRVTKYQGSFSDSNVSRTTTFPSGRTATYSYSQGTSTTSEQSSDSGVYLSRYYQNDVRFGKQAPFLQGFSESGGGVNYYQGNSQSVTLSDPDDPFSITAYSVSTFKGTLSVSTSFNPSAKKFTTTTGVGRTSEIEIDTYERIISQKAGGLHPLEFIYTDENLTKIKHDTRETNLIYNSTTGRLSSIANPLNQSTAFSYDNAGRVSAVVLPDLRVIAYGYDANGNLTGITPPNRPLHAFNFNSSELMNSYAPPTLSGVSTVNTLYAYNNDKQLTQITKPTGATVNFSYNTTTGALQHFVTSAGTFYVNEDYLTGLPGSISSPSGIQTYITYGGTTPVQYQVYAIPYTYSNKYTASMGSTGQVTSDVVATLTESSTIQYTYDNDEVLKTAGDITLTYNIPDGLLNGLTLGTGTTGFSDVYTHNSFGEVATYTAKRGTTTLYTLSLGRDGMGRINSKSEFMNATTNNFAYGFDSAGRLTQTDKNSTTVATYGYDDNSNRNAGTIGSQTTIASYNDQDWMTAYNSLTFTYNANGDMLTRTNTITNTTTNYVYDVFGNLTSVTLPSGTVITYEIDGLNRRVGKLINGVLQRRWIYMDQTRIAAEVDATGAITKRFIYGSKGNIPDYMIMAGNSYRIISDHLGSPRLVVKQSDGSIMQRMNHDEYGRVTEDTNPGLLPFGFAGGLYETQTSLVHFGARDYDAETGRWTSKDPILFGGGDSNLYGYVQNDPVNFIDPSGKIFERIIANHLTPNQQAVVGAALAAAGTYATVSGVSTLNGPLALLGAFATYEGIRNAQLAKDRGLSLPGLPGMNDVSSRSPSSANAATSLFPIPAQNSFPSSQGGTCPQ